MEISRQQDEVDLSSIPVNAIRLSTKKLLSEKLKSHKVLRSPSGHYRDWRGLADLMNVEWGPDMVRDDVRVFKIFDSWKEHKNSSFGKILEFLQEIDRFDIYDDIIDMLYNDARIYQHKTEGDFIDKPMIQPCSEEYQILTIDDVCRIKNGHSPQIYDAFVLYADKDELFAKELITKMEGDDYKLKLCVKDRDLIGVTFEHDAIMKLISERCRRLIVILSNDFKNSDRDNFFTKFAQAMALEQRTRKVIPCIYRKCEIPPEFKMYHKLDFSKATVLCDPWKKLHFSVTCSKMNNTYERTVTLGINSDSVQITKMKENIIEDVKKYEETKQTNSSSKPKKNTILKIFTGTKKTTKKAAVENN